MSQRLISRSDDLRRLIEHGFEIEIRGTFLLVRNVPYVDEKRRVRRGTLVIALELADDATVRPADHTARFIGLTPSDSQGRPLRKLINGGGGILGEDIAFDHSFSAKPAGGYRDYYHKVTAYVARLEGHARSIESSVTARTFVTPELNDPDSPFRYVDTATPRAGLELYSHRLRGMRIGIVGLGGTGSYILDLVAKTSVSEIHLYDGDRFVQHNAFRAPGATPGSELRRGPNKATHWARVFRRMRRGISARPRMVDASNIRELLRLDFVFIAIDDGPSRALILDELTKGRVACIDVGMGINDIEGRLSGKTRVSAGTSAHPIDRSRVPTAPTGGDNDYRHNIQIGELNALNAALAVIKWKKIMGIYADMESEHFSSYVTVVNQVVNEDRD